MADNIAQYDKGLAILEKSDLRTTKQRKDLLKFLSDFENRYVSVTEVDDYMQSIYPNASPYDDISQHQRIHGSWYY